MGFKFCEIKLGNRKVMQLCCKIAKTLCKGNTTPNAVPPKKKGKQKSDQTAQLAETGCRLADRQL